MSVATPRIKSAHLVTTWTLPLVLAMTIGAESASTRQIEAAEPASDQQQAERDPVTIKLISMDLTAAQGVLRKNDSNSNDELTLGELIRGLAWERRFRDELGIKGCDQGGAMKLINRGDKDGDRRIDRSELQLAGLGTEAMKFDRNADDELSVSELAERLAQRRIQLGLTPSDQLAARALLRQLDRDSDGIIVAAELPPQSAGSDLSEYDQNGDGDITELELEQVFANRRRELGYDDEDFERATTLVQRNDRDGNRSLSKRELEASGSDRSSPLSAGNLPLIDEDQDGKLSVSELARYLKKSR